MARYISKSTDFNKTVRQPVTSLVNGPHGPERVTTVDPIMAQFSQTGLTAYERELAKERFTFFGLAEGEDPLRRVSMFDTDEQGWPDDLKAELEAVLDAGQGEWYFRVDDLPAMKPWPSYDAQSPKQILETLALAGANPELVLAYERENKNRTQLMADVEAMTAANESELITAA